MSDKPTPAQLEFLANLGFKKGASLTRESASAKIDELLAAEKVAGAQLQCPACNGTLTTRPRRLTPCPHCKVKIRDVQGRLYTKEQLDQRDASTRGAADEQWFERQRELVAQQISMAVDADKSFGGAPAYGGFYIRVGKACTAAMEMDRTFVPLKLAESRPELLPPYEGICRKGECECDADLRDAHQRMPAKARAADRATKVPAKKSPNEVASKSGCMTAVLLITVVATTAAALVR